MATSSDWPSVIFGGGIAVVAHVQAHEGGRIVYAVKARAGDEVPSCCSSEPLNGFARFEPSDFPSSTPLRRDSND